MGLRREVVGILADKPVTPDLREVVDFVAVWGLTWASWGRRAVSLTRARVKAGAFGESRAIELITGLLKERDPPDANELRCFDLARRFHRWGRRDSIHGLRLVTAPVVDSDGKPCLTTDGQSLTRRYVWELACFEYWTGPEWKLVTWAIDEEALWFQRFQSERQAAAAFRQEPVPIRDIRA